MGPVSVEFAGLPGAGKTSIANALATRLSTLGYRCLAPSLARSTVVRRQGARRLLGRIGTVGHFGSYCLRHVRVVDGAVRYAWRVDPTNTASMRRAVKLLVRLSLLERLGLDEYEFTVFDQGVIQNIWSMAVTGAPPPIGFAKRLMERVPAPGPRLIVLVDIDVDTAVQRIGTRSSLSSRFDDMGSAAAAGVLGGRRTLFERIVDCACELDKTASLTVSGKDPIEDNASTILTCIERRRWDGEGRCVASGDQLRSLPG